MTASTVRSSRARATFAARNPETVRQRMAEYRAKTAPILPHYQARGLVRCVDGMAPIETVNRAIETILDS